MFVTKTLNYLWGLDIDSVFTNISLDKTIDVCVNQLFDKNDTVEGFTDSERQQIICLVTTESYFKQFTLQGGLAMASLVVPSFANAFFMP